MATVSSTPRTNRITLASPSAGPFEVGFRLFSADGLEVYVDGAVSVDFTVDATFTDGYDDAATITFGSSLPTDTVIQIDGAEVPLRSEDYLNPDPGLTRKINVELARITAVLSEVTMKVGRALRAFDDVAPSEGAETVDLTNLAAYAAEAEAARDEVLAIEALIPRRAGPWTTATAYVFGDLVQQDGSTYFCLVAHTAGTFNVDLASFYWEVWAQKGAAGAGAGDVIAANNGTEFNPATFISNFGITASIPELNRLVGTTSPVQTQLDGKQPLSAILTDIAAGGGTGDGTPAGCIAFFAGATVPTGWIKANGAAVSRATYADLFTAIGTTYGVGDGSTTFNVPDMRGEFARGWDDARGVDSGRVLGSAQSQEIQSHTHDMTFGSSATGLQSGSAKLQFTGPNAKTSTATGGAETRPRNIALMACIKT